MAKAAADAGRALRCPTSGVVLAVARRVHSAGALQRVVPHRGVGVMLTDLGALRSLAMRLLLALGHADATRAVVATIPLRYLLLVSIHILILLCLEVDQLPRQLLVVLVEHLLEDHVLGVAQLFIDCLERYFCVLVAELLDAPDDGLDHCPLRAVQLEDVAEGLYHGRVLDVSLLL